MKDEEYAIIMYNEVGDFAEDKDKAAHIRVNKIFPALKDGKIVILDFQSVNSTTQSFIHALISDVIRNEGITVLDRLFFRNCNEIVKGIIEIVVDYMQEPPIIVHKNGKTGHESLEKKSSPSRPL